MKAIRTLLVSRHKIFCEGIRHLFEATKFQVVSDVREPGDAVAFFKEGISYDLVVCELQSALTDLVASARDMSSPPRVVVLAPPQQPLPADFPVHEVDGLLNYSVSPSMLLHSLELVMSEEQIYPIDPTFLSALNSHGEAIVNFPKELDEFSWREIEILRCLALGHPNKIIARQLDIAETTVKAHVKTILRKTKTTNRTQAATWSMSRGIGSLEIPSPGLVGDLRHREQRNATSAINTAMDTKALERHRRGHVSASGSSHPIVN